MNRSLFNVLFGAFGTGGGVMAAGEEGEQNIREITADDAAVLMAYGKKVIVVYFYPADFTGGCTKEACAFRDEGKKLADKGIEVVGVSGDSAKNHEMFKKLHKLNFTLLADEDGSVAKAFGAVLGRRRRT